MSLHAPESWFPKWQELITRLQGATSPQLPETTSLRVLKEAVLRVLRVYTREQAAFNRGLLEAVETLGQSVAALSRGAMEAAGRHEATATAARDLGEKALASTGELRAVTSSLQHQVDSARAELAAQGARFNERLEWLTQFTDGFRKELFYELRQRLEEHERLTKPEVLDREAYAIKVRNMPNGLRINLGSGGRNAGEYLNVDQRAVDGVDIRADVRHLPFEEGQLSEIFCSHLVEHFPEAEMRSRVLPYWFKLLRKGGRLVVICPDADAMMRGWVAGNFPYDDLREVTFGSQDYVGNTHFTMYTPDSLRTLLQRQGFSEVQTRAVGRVNGKCLEMELEAIK